MDARILAVLWDNKKSIPQCWKESNEGMKTLISFDGTVFRAHGDKKNLFVLQLVWDDNSWVIRPAAFQKEFHEWDLSAVLEV